jgi:hypothetical protein
MPDCGYCGKPFEGLAHICGPFTGSTPEGRRKAWTLWAKTQPRFYRPAENIALQRVGAGRHPNDDRHELRCNLPSNFGSCVCLNPRPAPACQVDINLAIMQQLQTEVRKRPADPKCPGCGHRISEHGPFGNLGYNGCKWNSVDWGNGRGANDCSCSMTSAEIEEILKVRAVTEAFRITLTPPSLEESAIGDVMRESLHKMETRRADNIQLALLLAISKGKCPTCKSPASVTSLRVFDHPLPNIPVADIYALRR